MTKNNVRQLYAEQQQVVNHETGEVTYSKTTSVSRLPAEPAYVKLYIETIGSIENLSGPQRVLLHELALRVGYDGMIVVSPLSRKRIIAKLGISEKTYRNHMAALVKSGIIIRHSVSDFEANPNYFARGSWREILDRREDFELRVRFSPDGTRRVDSNRISDD